MRVEGTEIIPCTSDLQFQNCSLTSSFLEPGLCPPCGLPRKCWNLHAILLPLGKATYYSLAKYIQKCHKLFSHSSDKKFGPTIAMPWFRFPRWDLLQRSNSISAPSWSCGWSRLDTMAHQGDKFQVWWKIMALQGGSVCTYLFSLWGILWLGSIAKTQFAVWSLKTCRKKQLHTNLVEWSHPLKIEYNI